MLGALLRQLFGRNRAEKPAAPAPDWKARVGVLYTSGRHTEASAVCRQRLAVAPDDVDALEALAAALLAQGKTRDALQCLRKAADRAPRKAELQAYLGLVQAAKGEVEPAIESYRRALALRADLPEARLTLATLLKGAGRYDEAEDVCRAGLAADDRSGALHHALAGILFEQGRIEDTLAALRAALALEPDAPLVHSDLLRTLNYSDAQQPADVFMAHRAWDERHARALGQDAAPHRNAPDPHRRLRVGYVSPYFRKHAVTFFLESVIEHHDRDAFEILLYADVPRPDEYSERLRAYGAKWRSTVGKDDATLARMVRDDAVDILVDLSGHTPGHRLLAFARRPAPVQVTWNGYPNTTGMPAMGYRITDALCDPSGQTESLHCETLVRLPHIYMSWRAPEDAPDPGPLPALAKGHVTFGSFNSCFKVTPATIATWARILSAVPASRLVLFTVAEGRATERIRAGFAACGIPAERLAFVGRVTHEAFLRAHGEIDIALDTYPYHGTTTTCFSLWMGVPVVSLIGPTHVSRVGLTLLSSVGLPDLAASDTDAYVQAAVRLASDLEALAGLRRGLRERVRRSPLADGAACASALERAYRTMWEDWCLAAPRS